MLRTHLHFWENFLIAAKFTKKAKNGNNVLLSSEVK